MEAPRCTRRLGESSDRKEGGEWRGRSRIANHRRRELAMGARPRMSQRTIPGREENSKRTGQ
jgi:hypothetical protein